MDDTEQPVASTSTARPPLKPKAAVRRPKPAAAGPRDKSQDFFTNSRPPPAKKSSKLKAKSETPTTEHTSDSDRAEVPKRRKGGTNVLRVISDDEDTPASSASPLSKPKPKRARQRSLSPVMAVPAEALANVRAIVQSNMTFEAAATAPLDISSSDSEELGDTSLDPELQAIALQIATRRAEEEAEEEASKPSWAGDEVALTIRMQANPTIVRTAANQKGLAFYEKPLTTKLGVRDTFERVFSYIASQRGTHPHDLILTCNDRRVFPVATPASLQIFSSADLKGYDKSSWEATLELRQNQQTAAETAAEAEEESDEVEVVASSSPAKDKLVELTVRGKGMQQMSFSTKETASVRHVLRHFLKSYDLLDKLDKAWIEYEGERAPLDSALNELEDFEDGCCLDVHIP